MDDKHTIEALTNEVAWFTKENERLSEDNRRLARQAHVITSRTVCPSPTRMSTPYVRLSTSQKGNITAICLRSSFVRKKTKRRHMLKEGEIQNE